MPTATTPVAMAAMTPTTDVRVSQQPATTATTPPVTAPDNTTAAVVSNIVITAPNAFGRTTGPGVPAQAPTLWTLAAFARRDFEQTLSIPPPTVTAKASPMIDGTFAGAQTLNSQTAAAATFTGEPSIVARLVVVALRVAKSFGLDHETQVAPLLASDSPPWFTTLGLNVQRSEFDGWAVYTLQPPNPSGTTSLPFTGAHTFPSPIRS